MAGAFTRRLAWLCVLLAALWALVWLGEDPRLAGPDRSGWSDVTAWSDWFRATEPLDATFALLRWALVAVDVYLLVVTLLAAAARATGAVRAVRWVDAVTLPALRPVLHSIVGMGVVASSLGAPALAATAHAQPAVGGPPPPVSGPPAQPIATVHEEVPRPPPLLRRLPSDPPDRHPLERHHVPAGSGVRDHAAPDERRPSAARNDDPAHQGEQRSGAVEGTMAASTWVVAPGDHFWAIAERMVAATVDAEPTDAEVRVYWQRLVAANADRLHRAGDPDLLLPGQRLILPPVDSGLEPPASEGHGIGSTH